MKRTRDEIIAATRSIIGDRNDDEVLSYLEDISDSYNDDAEDWRQKYENEVSERERIDREWRERYTSRFYDGTVSEHNDTIIEETEVKKPQTFDDLFSNE